MLFMTENLPPHEQHSSLPEIIIPEDLLQERANFIKNFLATPPPVDVLLVPRRAGPIAATGLEKALQKIQGQRIQPKIIEIDGFGHETKARFIKAMNSYNAESLFDPEFAVDYATIQNEAHSSESSFAKREFYTFLMWMHDEYCAGSPDARLVRVHNAVQSMGIDATSLLTNGLGEDLDKEDKDIFFAWIAWKAVDQADTNNQTPSTIHEVVSELRSQLNSEKPDDEPPSVALLDDTHHEGTVAHSVAPALLNAAIGQEYKGYDPDNNRYIFRNSSWIDLIIRSTFKDQTLTPVQCIFMRELLKGSADLLSDESKKVDFTSVDHRISAARTIALAAPIEHGESDKNGDSITLLIGKYGAENLCAYSEKLRERFADHTKAIADTLQT